MTEPSRSGLKDKKIPTRFLVGVLFSIEVFICLVPIMSQPVEKVVPQ